MGVCPDVLERLGTEFKGLVPKLEANHELFRALWQLGEPRFTEEVPTAAIVFSSTGAPLRFLFNPEFWANLPLYDREFVVCHEMLHAVLNHGFRGRHLKKRVVANVAADIAVNHMLVERFGFCRGLLRDWKCLCWVDTVFEGPNLPSKDLTFEQYYDLCSHLIELEGLKLVDEHRFDPSAEGSLVNARAAAEMDAALGDLPPHLVREIADLLKAEGKVQVQRGTQQVGAFCSIHPVPAPKVTWEEWLRRKLRARDSEQDDWSALNRRIGGVDGLALPGRRERSDRSRDAFQACAFFIDASGSAWDHRDRFFALAKSMPSRAFSVDLYSFDTHVYELDLRKPRIRGGGGTSFRAIEEQLARESKKGKRYPDIVVVLTDGYGDSVEPQHPSRWHWLLTTGNKSFVPRGSATMLLRDFA